jgi:hypothetical protein
LAKPLTYTEIEAYLHEVADVLDEDGERRIVVVVGGALLAYYQIRNTTTDVDSARPIDQDLAAAIREVANRHGLDEDWLNPRGFPHRPLTLDEDECEVMLEHGRLKVLAAPVDQVFLMKLDSDRTRDQMDLVLAWPATSFQSAEEVLDAYRAAYPPGLPEDEYEYYLRMVEETIEEAEDLAQE